MTEKIKLIWSYCLFPVIKNIQKQKMADAFKLIWKNGLNVSAKKQVQTLIVILIFANSVQILSRFCQYYLLSNELSQQRS